MKIAIEHHGLKRGIEGTGFNICGSRDDLLLIANQIKERADRESFSYGWIKIRHETTDEHSAGGNSATFNWMK
jgi:hypothetical protein